MLSCKRLLVGVLFSAAAFGQSNRESVIIRANRPYDKVVAAIQARGGIVTHQYAYIDALAADVPANALAALRATDGVLSMTKDATMSAGPVRNDLTLRGLGAGQSPDLTPASANPLSSTDISGLSANISPSAYAVNNTLMGLDPLFAAGYQGNGVIVAVIDTGIRPGFPHISGSVIGGEDFVNDGNGFSNSANDGHGTFVSGMIAAHVSFLFPTTSVFVRALNKYAPGAAQPFNATLSQVPMVGTAPAAKIYALRAFDTAGNAPRSRIMAAMERVIQLRELYDSGAPGGMNIRVCNMSFTGSTIEPGLEPEDQLVDDLLAHDIVPVVAAANAGPAALTIGTPASSRSAIAVGAANLAHNQRVAIDVAFGFGVGGLYRPFDGTVMAFFSSRGPDADGRVQPNVVANGWDSFGMGGGTPDEIEFGFGTSLSTPTVSGIAAVLRQRFPAATARQIRNAILASADPTLVNAADVLDQGHGFVNATAASSLLAGGSVSNTVDPAPNANQSVKVNVEQNTPVKAVDGFVRQTLTLQPGQRHEVLYQVLPNTSQVIVSLSNFSASLPPNKQNQFFGDDIFFGVHSAKTSAIGDGDYLVPLDFVHNGTWIVNHPETGLMRISVNGDWTNAGSVSVDVTVLSMTDPVPQFTSQGKIITTQLVVVPVSVPAGTGVADFRLSWKDDWGSFPPADLDLILVSPTLKVNVAGATLNNPETVSITNPEVGNWIALIDGFNVPAGSDKYEFRVALDGKVVQ